MTSSAVASSTVKPRAFAQRGSFTGGFVPNDRVRVGGSCLQDRIGP